MTQCRETVIQGSREIDDLPTTVRLTPNADDPGGYDIDLNQGDQSWITLTSEEALQLSAYLQHALRHCSPCPDCAGDGEIRGIGPLYTSEGKLAGYGLRTWSCERCGRKDRE